MEETCGACAGRSSIISTALLCHSTIPSTAFHENLSPQPHLSSSHSYKIRRQTSVPVVHRSNRNGCFTHIATHSPFSPLASLTHLPAHFLQVLLHQTVQQVNGFLHGLFLIAVPVYHLHQVVLQALFFLLGGSGRGGLLRGRRVAAAAGHPLSCSREAGWMNVRPVWLCTGWWDGIG